MALRSWTAGIVLLGALVAGAAVNRAAVHARLDLDDYGQRAMIEGALTPHRGPFNLYDLIADDNRAALLDRGVIPWWSDAHLTVRFLRPLPSVLVWLDHRLFSYDPLGPHILSFFWWAGAVLAVHVLYRTVVGSTAALAATMVFALSPTLAIPLVWLANRNILVTLTCGALALASYVRWRNDRRPARGLATAAAFGATVFTGEYALCLVGYLVAFELSRRGEPIRSRLTGVLPAAVPFIVYAAVHAALGYGPAGSGFYRNPVADPGAYLEALPRSVAVLLASAWLNVGVTASWLGSPAARAILILIGAVFVVTTVRIARRRSPTAADGSPWLACGSVIALLPLAATEPSRRLLGIAAIGVSGAVGVLIAEAVRLLRHPLRRPALVGAAVVAGFIHLVAAPFQTRGLSTESVEDQVQNLARFSTIPHGVHAVDTTLVLRATYGLTVLSAPFLLGQDAPKHWRVLSHTFEQAAAIRTSPTSVEVVHENVALFPIGPTGIVRIAPFSVGDVVEIPGLHATVLRVDEHGSPTAVRYEFDQDLDSPQVAWIAEGRSGFTEVRPPPVGVGFRLGR